MTTTPKSPSLLRAWEIRNLTHAYEPRDPMRYLVAGLLPRPSLSILFGAPGSLKSLMLADLSACITQGATWLESMPGAEQGRSFSTEQAGVFWVDFDNGRRRTDERMAAVGRGHELEKEAPIHYTSMPTPWLDAGNQAFVASMADMVRQLGVGLVVIDNLGLVTGKIDENSPEIARVMGNFRFLAEEADAAVIIIHHQRKATGFLDVRKGETLRGHSSIEASLDLALHIDRKESTESVTVTATKTRGFRVDTFGAFMTYTHIPRSYDLESARFWAEPIKSESQRERVELESIILQVLAKQPLTQRELVDAVRTEMILRGGKSAGRDKIIAFADSMAGDKLTCEYGTKNAKRYLVS